MKYASLLSLVSFLVNTAFSTQECCNENPCPFVGGDPYQEAPVFRSVNGELDIVMTVEIAEIQIEWLRIFRRTYNGSIPAPTWHIKAGDTVRVTLINKLTTTPNNKPNNALRFPNITNLHTHGLHISSKEPQDNVFVSVHPQQSYQYVYHIQENHIPGTFWYHAHVHGSTFFHVHSSLAGMIIVEDPTSGIMAMPKHLDDISCPNNCENDHAIIFQPILQYSGMGFRQLQLLIGDDPAFMSNELINDGGSLADWLENPANGIDYYLANGLLFPKLQMQTGKRKRLRMVNGGGFMTLEIQITDVGQQTPTDACEFYEIAYDGVYLDLVRKPKLNKSYLISGSKVDWILVCNRPGHYEIRSVPDPLDSCSMGEMGRFNNRLVTLEVTGRPVAPSAQETALPKRPFPSGDFRYLHPSQVVSGFVLEANTHQHVNRERFTSHNRFRYKGTVGTVQEWRLTNTDTILGHPMHIHVNNFQVISYNKYTGPASFQSINTTIGAVYYSQKGVKCTHQSKNYLPGEVGIFHLPVADENGVCEHGEFVDHQARQKRGGPGTLAYVEPGEFRDAIMVPPMADITIRFLADEFTGEVVIHCHILLHEDWGMIMTVELVEDGQPTDDAQIDSGGAIPGKCFDGDV